MSGPQIDPHLSRAEGINWMVRQIQNDAMSLYMAGPYREVYDEIVTHLKAALDGINTYAHEMEFGCPDGWCTDPRDRCVPCGNNEEREEK